MHFQNIFMQFSLCIEIIEIALESHSFNGFFYCLRFLILW